MSETQTDWRTLPAGPELDALVAERVLGWSNCHIGPTYRKAMGIPPEMLAKQPPDRTINFPCHHYSQAIGCAWEVVEAMERHGFWLNLLTDWYPGRSRSSAWFTPHNKHHDQERFVHANTAPLAIVRAALEVAHG